MSVPAILITQCLQHDFVAPVGRYDALPNLLHIGFEEARRLMGDNPDEGPVARVMRSAQQQADTQLKLVHIRDWHDAADSAQLQHLQQFGAHCIKGTHGARFAFPDASGSHKAVTIIDSPGLHDFLGTPLADDLATGAGPQSRIGLMGVWTEVKVSFLAYECEGSEGGMPDGLTEIEADELGPVRHPSEDPAVAGDAGGDDSSGDPGAGEESPDVAGGQKSTSPPRGARDVGEYRALVKQLNPRASDEDITVHYFRERARPYLIRFSERESPIAQEPIPEGLETWDIGRDISEVDWVESVTHSPNVVPGLTTLARVYGATPGADPHQEPLYLYVGIDCSGSMPNPRLSLSYPVLAGFVVAQSALRAGAGVMACLSGEPGKSIATDGFRRDQESVSRLLTDYLGSGYSYGIFRLNNMAKALVKPRRPVHLLIITDTDIFTSLAEVQGKGSAQREGCQAAEAGLREAGGGGTMLLHATTAHLKQYAKSVDRLESQGWRVVNVNDWEDVLEFARQFSLQLWSRK